MARLSRYTQQIFGSGAGSNQMAEFGSFAASAPATYSGATITPTIIQTLSNYLTGWFGAVVGGNSPCIEDMNSLFYLVTYQLSYLLSLGTPEWDSGTTYYIGSVVQDGAGNGYVSVTNNNLNNALSSGANWRRQTASTGDNDVAFNPAVSSPYTLAAGDAGKTFMVNTANGASTFNLPNPSGNANFTFALKDIAGQALTNTITLHRFAAENFENVAADYVAHAPYGEWKISTDGTNWYITG